MKRWLENNKIYFETVAAASLSIMAALISYGQWVAAREQAALSKAEAAPVFDLRTRYEPDSEGFAADEIIEITNEGGLARNLAVETVVYFDLDGYIDSMPMRDLKARVPVSDYYNTTMYTGESKGVVLELRGNGNNSKAAELQRGLRDFAGKNQAVLSLLVTQYVQLKYTDKFGDAHSDVYLVSPIYGAEVVDERDGRAVFEHSKKEARIVEPLVLTSTTAEQLFALVVGQSAP